MGILIDSSVFIDYERGRIDLPAMLREFPEPDSAMSVITVSELLHGVHRADESRRERRLAFVSGLLATFPSFPIDAHVARIHAGIWASLSGRGETVAPHDLWIAATAIANDLEVATANERHFRRVPGLLVQVWR